MEKLVASSDGVEIHYQEFGKGMVSIVFVHGWLGNVNWWSNQQSYFKDRYHIIQIDLGGHGKSGRLRQHWSSNQYSHDIEVVINQLETSRVILVGHSMSGAYALQAAVNCRKIIAVILVDTLKDMDKLISYEQAEQFLFDHYRKDFRSAVENLLPQHLFVETTPTSIIRRLKKEFLSNDPKFAISSIQPLYETDIRALAKQVKVPVRAINSDSNPTNVGNNRKYLQNYSVVTIAGTGHYPMMEKPDEFNGIIESLFLELIE